MYYILLLLLKLSSFLLNTQNDIYFQYIKMYVLLRGYFEQRKNLHQIFLNFVKWLLSSNCIIVNQTKIRTYVNGFVMCI